MNPLTVSLILISLLSVIDVFGTSAKPTAYQPKFQSVGDVGDKQVATVEFEWNEKNFTDKTYGNLHQEILDALNRRKTTTATIEQQTTQQTTEQTTKTTVTTATTVEETTSSAGSTAIEDLTTTETTEQTTTTGPAATTTYKMGPLPPDSRKRRSVLSDEIVYENEDVFFIDLGNNKINNGIIRVPVGLHKEGYNISNDRLYNVLIGLYTNNTGELGFHDGLRVVNIYRGLPALLLPAKTESRPSWIYIPIVVTLGFLLLILLFGALYFVLFRSNVRYVVQKYCKQVQGRDVLRNHITTTTAERRPSSASNGQFISPHNNQPNEVHPMILGDDYDRWLIPMSEFNSEHSMTEVPLRQDFNLTN